VHVGAAVALGDAPLNVCLSKGIVNGLGDGDAMHSHVELAVAVAGGPEATVGVTGPVRYRCEPDVAGEGGFAFEPPDTGDLGHDPGGGQFGAARKFK